jgi:midasin (ATPase involved in ribosome maturation)
VSARLNLDPLTDPGAIRRLLRRGSPATRLAAAKGPVPKSTGGFVGWQIKTIAEALELGLNALLVGPTGTGKTKAVEEAVLTSAYQLVTVEGKEGLQDLDFLGAILPQPDNTRRWVDGPLLRAMRQAQNEPVAFFIDELNRIPRPHQNLLLGLMNPKPRELCERQGVEVEGDGPFYVTEVPMMSETVWAPADSLRFIGAGNWGAEYAVYPLDPALRRRFNLIVEFDYLELDDEKKLVLRRTGVEEAVAHTLCLLAQRTREMRRNAELPGCIDTGSLLTWARLCAARKAATLSDALALGKLVWADLACGRDHLGQVNLGKFHGLVDYLTKASLKLPPGDLSRLDTWTM